MIHCPKDPFGDKGTDEKIHFIMRSVTEELLRPFS